MNKQLMQSFLDRRAILSLKKRQTMANQGLGTFGGKSITTPNSPRISTVKQIKHSDKSNGSYGGDFCALEEVRVENLNVALLNVSEKLQAFQTQQQQQQQAHIQQSIQNHINFPQTNQKHKIVLPKGIINFSGAQSRGQSSGGSKSAERTARRPGLSHEPREESLRRKKKVMQIIRNFENDNQQLDLPQHTQAQPEGQLNQKELSFMLKSKILKHQERDMPSLADNRSKIIIHKRITKTFTGNTPEQQKIQTLCELFCFNFFLEILKFVVFDTPSNIGFLRYFGLQILREDKNQTAREVEGQEASTPNKR